MKLGLCASLLAPSSNDNWVAAMRRCHSRPTTTKYIYVTEPFAIPLAEQGVEVKEVVAFGC